MDISIIIINYQSERYLTSCIESIKRHCLNVSYEILIINNDSTSLKNIFSDSSLAVIENNVNEGFAKTCNKGAALARGKILLFLNPDVEILSGDMNELLTIFDDPAIGIVSPLLLSDINTVQPWSSGYDITPSEIIRNNLGSIRSKALWKKDTNLQPDWISGAALAISSVLFKKIKGFDESFFMYFEDVDLCKRIKKMGLQIKLFPPMQILHFGGGSSAGHIQQKKYYYASQDHYLKKYFNPSFLLFLKIIRSLSLSFKKING